MMQSTHNQLQFNLNVPSAANNLAARHHRPGPLIIDRASGPLGGRQIPVQHSQPNVSAGMNFSSLSEDRLTAAVRLAQRDMKKKREEEFLKEFVKDQRIRSRSPSPKSSRTRKIPGQDIWLRQRRRQPLKGTSGARAPLKVKEHDRNNATHTRRTQTPPRYPGPVDRRVPDPSMPVTTNSPPRRDTDMKIYPVPKSAPCDQPAKEIERLQREMESYLQQIQAIEQRAMQDPDTGFLKPSSRPKAKSGYLEKEEDEDRKKHRSEELATRAARQLYMLKQQVRQIQNDVIRIGPHKIKHTKKSRAYASLAAVHRGAVRAIQSFVTNLPHADLKRGLPTNYHELALLIRQITLVSNQLGADDKSTVQEDLLKMLDNVDDLNQAWCQDMPENEIAATQESAPVRSKPRQTSPSTRERPLFVIEAPKRGRQPQAKRGKENKPKGIIKTHGAGVRSGVRRQVKVESSPERKSALRAGIAALVDAGELKHGRSGMAWDMSLSDAPPAAAAKSLILPGKLQEKRVRAQQAVVKSIPDCHFADPTLSSNLKAHSPQRNLLLEDSERSFSAPPTPVASHRREQSASPGRQGRAPWKGGGIASRASSRGRSRKTRSQSPTVTRQFLIQDMVDSDVAKALFPSSEEGVSHQRQSRSQRRQRSMSPTDRLVTRAEMAIKKRLQPLLNQAETIASRHKKSGSSSQRLENRAAIDEVEEQGDQLTEMILNDVLRDTAGELNRQQLEESARRTAVTMQDSPTLENLLQRLEEMEMEQYDIRNRWRTIEFSSSEPVRRPTETKIDPRPLAPAAMEITRNTVPQRSMQRNLDLNKNEGNDPIIFTKLRSVPQFTETRVYEESQEMLSEGAYRTCGPPETPLTLPDSVVQKIHSNVDSYDRYLKKISHHPTGKFDPWKLMEEVSDHILKECIEDIAVELEDLNNTIVNQVCKTEFTVPKSPIPSSPVPSSPGPGSLDPVSPVISGRNSPAVVHTGPRSPSPGPSSGIESPKVVMFREQPIQFDIPDYDTMRRERENSTDNVDDDEDDDDDDDDDDEDDDSDDDDDDDDYDYEDDYEEDDQTKSFTQ